MRPIRPATRHTPELLGRRENTPYAAAWGAVFALYLIVWSPALSLGDFLIWDEWVIHNVPFDSIKGQMSDAGFPWWAYIYFFEEIPSWVYRAASIVLYGLGAVWWGFILPRQFSVDRWVVLASVSLLLFAPIYMARISWVQLPAIIGLLVFLAAWQVVSRQTALGVPRTLAAAVLVFLATVIYPAFGALSFGIGVALAYRFGVKPQQGPGFAQHLLQASAIPVSGLAAIVLKRMFFVTSGSYLSYQEIVIGARLGMLLAALGTLGLFFVVRIFMLHVGRLKMMSLIDTVALGAFLLLLGIAPYGATSIWPPFQEWQTRYEVTLFLGLSLAIAAIVSRGRARISSLIFTVVGLVLSLALASSTYGLVRGIDLEKAKQDQVLDFVAQNQSLLRGTFIVVDDRNTGDNFFGRTLRPYEWTGIVAKALNEQNSFAVELQNGQQVDEVVGDYLSGGYRNYGQSFNYWWSDHETGRAIALMTISRADEFSQDNPTYVVELHGFNSTKKFVPHER